MKTKKITIEKKVLGVFKSKARPANPTNETDPTTTIISITRTGF